MLRVGAVWLGGEELVAELARLTESSLREQGFDSQNGGLRPQAPLHETMVVLVEG